MMGVNGTVSGVSGRFIVTSFQVNADVSRRMSCEVILQSVGPFSIDGYDLIGMEVDLAVNDGGQLRSLADAKRITKRPDGGRLIDFEA